MIFEEFTNAIDQIARAYLRQQATDPAARERWQAELDTLRKIYPFHLKAWAAMPAPKPAADEHRAQLWATERLAPDDLTLNDYTFICKWYRDAAGLYPAMQAAAKGRKVFAQVFAQQCPTVAQRQAAFTKFAQLAQAVLDADPATLPQLDVGLMGRGWLDQQAVVLPYSTAWENARREAAEVMGYPDRWLL